MANEGYFNKSIIVLDDEEMIRMLNRKMLNSGGDIATHQLRPRTTVFSEPKTPQTNANESKVTQNEVWGAI